MTKKAKYIWLFNVVAAVSLFSLAWSNDVGPITVFGRDRQGKPTKELVSVLAVNVYSKERQAFYPNQYGFVRVPNNFLIVSAKYKTEKGARLGYGVVKGLDQLRRR